jgi:hypothetical protein
MFYDIAGKKFKDVHYVEKVCSDLQIPAGAHSDISGVDLKDEIIGVNQHLQSSMTPLEVYNHLFKTGLETLSEHHYCFEDTAYHACNCCWR